MCPHTLLLHTTATIFTTCRRRVRWWPARSLWWPARSLCTCRSTVYAIYVSSYVTNSRRSANGIVVYSTLRRLYVSSCYWIPLLRAHVAGVYASGTIYVSSYYYIPLYYCYEHMSQACALVALYVSSYYYIPLYYCLTSQACTLVALYMCPHTTIYHFTTASRRRRVR
jgi:hypothetical protein